MASPAQVLANRANAQRSCGPKTDAGKAASSQNATRHGLSSAHFALLPGEDPAEFAELLQSLRHEFKPTTGHEHFLVDTMAKSRWRLARIERLESEAFDALDGSLLENLKSNNNILDKLARYSAAAERSYYKALRELEAGRSKKARVQNEANQYLLDQLLGVPAPGRPNAAVQNEPNSRPTFTVVPARTAPPAPETAS